MKQKNSDSRRKLTPNVAFATTTRLSQPKKINNHQFIRDKISNCQSRQARKMP